MVTKKTLLYLLYTSPTHSLHRLPSIYEVKFLLKFWMASLSFFSSSLLSEPSFSIAERMSDWSLFMLKEVSMDIDDLDVTVTYCARMSASH